MLLLPSNGPRSQARTDLAAARNQLHLLRDYYGVSNAVVRSTRHRFTHDNGRGPIIVVLRQTVGDVDVFHGDVKVMLDRSRRVRAVSGALHPAAQAKTAQTFALDSDEAISLALRDLLPETAPPATPMRSLGLADGGWERFELVAAPGFAFRRPARVKKVYFPEGDALLPAYHLEVQTSQLGGETMVVEYVIAAEDGRVLVRRDLTEYESFQYRVWADEGGDHRPDDCPFVDNSPYPGGVPGQGPTQFAQPKLITMEGFNIHNDPWLPDGATESIGNNVDAYVDHANPDGLSGDEYRASITAPGVFDHTYDVTQEPLANQTQSMAATVQLFYTINWLHDWWYDSGFNEEAGNAQENNYGRGGVEGDVLHAHAQDAALEGARNNANMSTPADGESPRMQMYLATAASASLTVNPLDASYTVGTAGFGPGQFDVTATIALLDDGQGEINDGCEPAVNNLAGMIALVDRGSCTFETKVGHAEAAGAVGVLIANNQPGDSAPTLGPDNNHPDPSIPSLGISNNAGNEIKAAMQNDPQTGHMLRENQVERDGTIDNLIIAHELGHYIHNRMVENGSIQTRGQGEGWGDFIGLHMSLREGDDLDGAYGFPYYAAFFADPTGYFGYRRVTYSADFDKNALTFRHISNGEPLPDTAPLDPNGLANSQVHNTGEVWSTMLWQSYIALHKAHEGQVEFEAIHRRMTDYIVGGMLMAPSLPTFTEQRDGILLAIAASDTPEDYGIVAAAFAERGAGTCAVSPERMSEDLVGVVEDFELSARGVISGVSMTDTNSCDDDGIVDIGELGHITVDLLNTGSGALEAGSTIEVVDPDPNLVFPDGPVTTLPEVGPGMGHTATIAVAVDESLQSYQPVIVTLRLTAPNGCETVIEQELRTTIHGDIVANSSKTDDVETPNSPWIAGGTDGDEIWMRAPYAEGFRWHGDDVGRQSDTWIETPTLEVSADEPLVVTFDHAFSFEFSNDTYWDGGLIEISGDDGENWEDVSAYIDPGYVAPINSAANPLDGRPAFVGDSSAYPDMEQLVLDFGDNFAGTQAKLRFRIGTDAAAGGPGWDIDNIAFAGIDNTPFSSWVTDEDECMVGTDSDTTDATTDDPTDATTDEPTTDATTDATDSDTTDATDTDGTSDSDSVGTTTVTPTTTAGPTSGDPASGSDTDSDSEGTDTDSGGEVVEDGCGCRSNDNNAPAGAALLGLALFGLRRRRH